jgi:hypothetical protein
MTRKSSPDVSDATFKKKWKEESHWLVIFSAITQKQLRAVIDTSHLSPSQDMMIRDMRGWHTVMVGDRSQAYSLAFVDAVGDCALTAKICQRADLPKLPGIYGIAVRVTGAELEDIGQQIERNTSLDHALAEVAVTGLGYGTAARKKESGSIGTAYLYVPIVNGQVNGGKNGSEFVKPPLSPVQAKLLHMFTLTSPNKKWDSLLRSHPSPDVAIDDHEIDYPYPAAMAGNELKSVDDIVHVLYMYLAGRGIDSNSIHLYTDDGLDTAYMQTSLEQLVSTAWYNLNDNKNQKRVRLTQPLWDNCILPTIARTASNAELSNDNKASLRNYAHVHSSTLENILADAYPDVPYAQLVEAALRAVREFLTKEWKYKMSGAVKTWPRGAMLNIEKHKGLGV